MQKNRREARAALFTHQLGWDVRLLIRARLEVVQTQVCRDQEAVLKTGDQWKQATIFSDSSGEAQSIVAEGDAVPARRNASSNRSGRRLTANRIQR